MQRRTLSSLAAICFLPIFTAYCGGDEQAAPPQSPPTPSATPSTAPTVAIADPVLPKGPTAPMTAKKSVSHDYFGVSVKDDYEWLEDSKNPEVKAWSDEENAYTHQVINAFPERERVKARASELLTQRSASYFDLRNVGGTWFALKNQPPLQQNLLVARTSLDDDKTEHAVVNPNELDKTGGTAIDWFVPSRDGKLALVSLSRGGSERGDLHVIDVATGKERASQSKTGEAFEIVSHVQNGTAGGSAAWNKDGTGFFYTRYPRQGEPHADDDSFYQQVWFHKLGTPAASDTYAIGKDFPRIAEVALDTSPDGQSVLATIENGDGGEYEHFVAGADGKFSQLSKFEDKWAEASFGADNALYVLSRKDAPRGQILRISRPFKKPEVVVAQDDGVIEQFTATAHTLYVAELLGGPSRLLAYSTEKKNAKPEQIPIADVSSIGEVARTQKGDDLVYRAQSYSEPPAYFVWDAKKKLATKTALVQTTPAKMDDVEVVRDQCTSKDGTKVPVNIIRKRGLTLDGSHPTLLTGYGGYSVSRKPRFRAITRLWLDAGGVYAEANLRGGGEFGEAWHLAGNLTNKQNVFDDFYACEKFMIDAKYTQSSKLAIMGGSNGGLLMGATLVQHPEMAHAVISQVGIYDMLRVELSPNGAFNVTEFGTVKKEEHFKALYAYSPFHGVKDGTAYPALFMLTGANDPRVDPFHSRKFTARLQAASSSGLPILLRTSNDTGHGIGTPLAAEIEEDADIYAFLLHELGASLPN